MPPPPPPPPAAAAKLELRQRFEKQRAARRCGAAAKSVHDKVTGTIPNLSFLSFTLEAFMLLPLPSVGHG
ncbi:hypothetical protein E2C01_035853 [Portunus trituberculatus]|uniref:Uncharacterized protein n=1 Tax=Portunus trituberculatus TaxID=210409 RepID=A0A5B7F9K9_PORTR|nr:hypothetical protein [Portunus trituberculatus]